MPLPDKLPSYAELPVRAGAPPGSAWGVFGDDDQVGCVNLMTPEKALEAAKLVRTGKSFALNWELEQPNPALFRRGNFRHTITGQGGAGRDDVIDNFWPQASSQWDGLSHVSHPQHGFYNGVTGEQITGLAGTRNGIEHWGRRGMVTRGVLLDVARYLEGQGRPVQGNESHRFSVDELEATRQAASVEVRPGDILIIRSGWMAWYNSAGPQERAAAAQPVTLRAPGIAATEDMAAYLWDLHIAGIAGDHPSLEAWPPTAETGGFLHQRLIGLLGIAIGELWYLEDLAADCAADGVYEFMITSAPLNVLGGVGSPPNAIAIK